MIFYAKRMLMELFFNSGYRTMKNTPNNCVYFYNSRHNVKNRGFACLKVDEKKSQTFISRGKTKVIEHATFIRDDTVQGGDFLGLAPLIDGKGITIAREAMQIVKEYKAEKTTLAGGTKFWFTDQFMIRSTPTHPSLV